MTSLGDFIRSIINHYGPRSVAFMGVGGLGCCHLQVFDAPGPWCVDEQEQHCDHLPVPTELAAGRHMDMNANTLMRNPEWNRILELVKR